MRAPSAWTWRRTLSKPRFRICANWPRWRPNLRRTRSRSFANASRKIWRDFVPPEPTSRRRAHLDRLTRAAFCLPLLKQGYLPLAAAGVALNRGRGRRQEGIEPFLDDGVAFA